MANSNKAVDQDQHNNSTIYRYFQSHNRYDRLQEAGLRAISLIEQGRLTILTPNPFPVLNNQRPEPKKRQCVSFKISRQRQTHNRTPPHHQISNKNKRFLESLLQRYRIFEAAVQKLDNSEQNQKLASQIFQKICHYEQLLRVSLQRLPISQQQKQFIEQETYNIRLAYSMTQDDAHLKEQARRLNCSLHRKNKYYDCLQEIRKKISTLQDTPSELQQRLQQVKPILTQTSESTRKTPLERRLKPLIRPQVIKGRGYLNISRQIGVQSKQKYQKQRGKVVYLKEVVHHCWPNHNDTQRLATVQSSLV